MIVVVGSVAVGGALTPQPATAQEVMLAVVDVVKVAEGYRSRDLREKPVFNGKGERVGELDDVIIGKDGRALFAIVEVGGFLGIGERLVALPWSELNVSPGGDRIVVASATREEVKKLPEFNYRGSARTGA